MFKQLIAIAIAGGLGALARWFLTTMIDCRFVSGFPWGTLFVNVVGCLLFGIIAGLNESRLSPELRRALLIGFVGSLTTFSTFAFDVQRLATARAWFYALLVLITHNVVGILMVALAIALVRAKL